MLTKKQAVHKKLFIAVFVLLQYAGSAQLKQLQVNGVNIHYRDTGSGEAVIFVHGSLEDYRNWDAQLDSFSTSFRAISYSRRYNFPNTSSRLLSNFSPATEAEDLRALVDSLKLDRVHLVGHSFGGFTALLFANRYAARVRTLTLSDPAIISWVPAQNKFRKELYEGTFKKVRAAFLQKDTTSVLRTTLRFFAGEDILDELPPFVIETIKQNLGEWRAIAYSSQPFPSISKTEVAKLPFPVLFIFAGKTLPILQIVNGELKKILPDARKLVLADATHDLWFNHGKEAGTAVLQFIRSNAD